MGNVDGEAEAFAEANHQYSDSTPRLDLEGGDG